MSETFTISLFGAMKRYFYVKKSECPVPCTGMNGQLRQGEMIFKNTRGFTLIELVMVIFLAGLLFSLTIPRFRDTILTDSMKGTVRKITAIIAGLRNDAVREQKNYSLRFNLESNQYWIESADMSDIDRAAARENASLLPKDICIIDIWFKDSGKMMMGEASIWVNREGYIQPSVIHLRSEDGRHFSLVLRTFLTKVEVLDRYVEFEDL